MWNNFNGCPPYDSDINQEEEFVQLININNVLTKQTLADFW